MVTPLPPHGEWRRALALDRSAGGPHAVVLAFVPQAIVDDAGRLAALVRNAEAAGRLQHPAAVPVLGTETVGDALAVVEAHRPGPTLREILDAGGRLPADVAARVVADVAAALARAHAIDAGDGKRLAHGAVAPSRIVIGADGTALLGDFGTGPEVDPAADVRALAAVLYECLEGEPPGRPPAPPASAGVAPALASALSRALLIEPGEAPSAAELAEAAGAPGAAASHAAVAVYADAMLPPSEGARAATLQALAAALGGGPEQEVTPEDIVEPTYPGVAAPAGLRAAALPARPITRPPPEPTPEPLPRPPATRPGADPAGVFPAPAHPAAPRPWAPLWVAFVCAALGFAVGFVAARWAAAPLSPAPPVAERAEGPAAIPGPPAPPAVGTTPAAVRSEPAPGPPPRLAGASKRAAKAMRSQKPPAAARAGKGTLSVTAPDAAELFLDGRRIGQGNVKVEVEAGRHRIEARMGEARVAERFTLEPGETWTYDVTPTP